MPKPTSCALLSLVFMMATVSAQANMVGNAYDIKTKQLLYTERHSTGMEGQQQVMRSTYLDPQGEVIANRTVTYSDDKVSHYQLQQSSINYTESIHRNDGSIEISVTENIEKGAKTNSINNAEEVVIDAGFSDFIVQNWDELLQGEPIKFKFASTSRMDIVNLQVRFDEQLDDTVMFSMTAANPFLRMLLTPISVGYTTDSKELAYYKGVSNLQDEDGDYYDVEIRFQ